jgi:hypothetical protein
MSRPVDPFDPQGDRARQQRAAERREQLAAGGILHTSSGVSAFTGKPFVLASWGVESGQLTPDEARALALRIVEAAAAAEHDALVLRWLQERMDLPADTAAQALVDLRELRGHS